MPQSRLSLARVDLPPDLSQSIISMGTFQYHLVVHGGPQPVSEVRDNEAASAATLVGNVSTSTPLTKFQVAHPIVASILPADRVYLQSVSETLKGRNRVKHTVGPIVPHNGQQLLTARKPSLVQLRSPDGKIELFYDREKNEFFSAAWEETPGNHHYEGDEEGNSLLNEASILAHSVRALSVWHFSC